MPKILPGSLGPLENTRAWEGERAKCLRNKDTQRQTDLGELSLLSGLVRIFVLYPLASNFAFKGTFSLGIQPPTIDLPHGEKLQKEKVIKQSGD